SRSCWRIACTGRPAATTSTTWGGADEDARAAHFGAARYRRGADARAEAARPAAVYLARGAGPAAVQRVADLPARERGRSAGAADQRLARPVRHHARGR